MTSPASAIVANGIRLALGSRTVLDRVDLAVPAGQITAVVGPNGAGKSTLLRALAGQLSPIAGTISLAGRSLAAYSAQERARAITYLPQERAVHWPLSVRAVVALGRLPHRDLSQNAGADAAAIENALRAMDAIDLADRPISDLSVANAHASLSHGRWRRRRRSCWPTSRQPDSTHRTR